MIAMCETTQRARGKEEKRKGNEGKKIRDM